MIHLALPPFWLGWSLECPVWVTGHMERHIIHIIHSFGVNFFARFPGKPRVFWKDPSSEGVFLVRKIRVFLFLHRKKKRLFKRPFSFGRPFFVDDFGARILVKSGMAPDNLPQLKKHDWAGLVLILMPTKWSWSCKARPARRARAC